MDTNAGIYIHVPFCHRKCQYCNFYSLTKHSHSLYKTYYDNILRDARIIKRWLNEQEISYGTIYLGGGTPSVLPKAILEKIISEFLHEKVTEITLEINPGTVTQEDLKDYATIGISRISIGVQSLEDCVLSWLGRIHTAQQAIECIQSVQKYFHNYSVDIMYAIPEVPCSVTEKTLQSLLQLGTIPHISAYPLSIEEDTPFAKEGISISSEQFVEEYIYIHSYLKELGYEHYEVSNFAQKQFRSQHNSKYWTRQSYLGLGPASHSLWNKRRFNFEDWDDFCQHTIQEKFSQAIELTNEDAREENIMLGMRTKEGISTKILQTPQTVLEHLQEQGLIKLESSNHQIRATLQGWMVLNQVITKLL